MGTGLTPFEGSARIELGELRGDGGGEFSGRGGGIGRGGEGWGGEGIGLRIGGIGEGTGLRGIGGETREGKGLVLVEEQRGMLSGLSFSLHVFRGDKILLSYSPAHLLLSHSSTYLAFFPSSLHRFTSVIAKNRVLPLGFVGGGMGGWGRKYM